MELIQNKKKMYQKVLGHSQKWICFEKSVIFFMYFEKATIFEEIS